MVATAFDPKRFIADFERAFQTRDYSTVRGYYDPNVEFATDTKGGTARGLDAFEAFWSTWGENFSDARIEILQSVVHGRDVAILQRCLGKHTGDGFEIAPGERVPATQKRISIHVAEFIKLGADGKIVRDDGIMDTGEMMRQLGVLPSATQESATRSAVPR
jgi:predicted ester cyclase